MNGNQSCGLDSHFRQKPFDFFDMSVKVYPLSTMTL